MQQAASPPASSSPAALSASSQSHRTLSMRRVRKHVKNCEGHHIVRYTQHQDISGECTWVARDIKHVLEAGNQRSRLVVQPGARRVDQDGLREGLPQCAGDVALGQRAGRPHKLHVPHAIGPEALLGRLGQHAVYLHRQHLAEVRRQRHGVCAGAAVQLQQRRRPPTLPADQGGLGTEPVKAANLAGRVRIRELALRLQVAQLPSVCQGQALEQAGALHCQAAALPSANNVDTGHDARSGKLLLKNLPEFGRGSKPCLSLGAIL
mmetsp:Transcript_510/g.1554  ORF Transcript_510/g.1554 Transcript_510/m.1554 type:complete len:264 (+) Transcript_510:175-966(+)